MSCAFAKGENTREWPSGAPAAWETFFRGAARSNCHALTPSKGAAGRGETACPPPCALTAFCAPEIWECWRLFFGLRASHVFGVYFKFPFKFRRRQSHPASLFAPPWWSAACRAHPARSFFWPSPGGAGAWLSAHVRGPGLLKG
jgi:hypothetical protein